MSATHNESGTATLADQVYRLHTRDLQHLVRAGNLSSDAAALIAHRALADYARTITGRQHAAWQDAWNALTGATKMRPGHLDVMPACASCHGRRISLRGHSVARAVTRGLPMGYCGVCAGTGRGLPTRIIAYAA